MRLFFAVKLNEQTKDHIMGITNRLNGCSNKGNFTKIDNLHITVLFIGETQRTALADIISTLHTVQETAFSLVLNRLGKFNMGRKGTLYYLGIQENQSLLNIHNQLYDKLTKKGFLLSNNRKYKPHITIGRSVEISDQRELSRLKDFCHKNTHKISVDSISLFKSERIDGELIYTEIYSFSLQ